MQNDNVTVFISYSWDGHTHELWVKTLADELTKGGVEVILDQYDLKLGKSMTLFMEAGLERADKVLIILTPNYKIKATDRKAGIGYEYSMISHELYQTQSNNSKFLPILRSGNRDSSTPIFLKPFISLDMSDDDLFNSNVFKLLRVIYDEPEFQKPPLGSKPSFATITNSVDPILELAKNISTRNELKQRKEHFGNTKGLEIAREQILPLFKAIDTKTRELKEATKLHFNCQFNDWRCIIYGHLGICMDVWFRDTSMYDLEKVSLNFDIYDKTIYLDRNHHYFGGQTPVPKLRQSFKLSISDELTIEWSNGQITIIESKLPEYIFARLLEYIRKRE